MTIARNTWVGVTSNVSTPATSVSAGGYGKKMGDWTSSPSMDDRRRKETVSRATRLRASARTASGEPRSPARTARDGDGRWPAAHPPSRRDGRVRARERHLNGTCKQYFDETYPARTIVGVPELLGGAAVTVDAVVAVE